MTFLRLHARLGEIRLHPFQNKGYSADTHTHRSLRCPFIPVRGWPCTAEVGLDQGYLWPREVMLSWHCHHPPGTPAEPLTLFPEESCPCPLALCHSCTLLLTRATPGVPQEVHEHLHHTEVAEREGAGPVRSFRSYPIRAPLCCARREVAFPGERATDPNSSSGKLLSAQPAAPRPR